MIGVDTNVLLRLLVDDDAEQCSQARSFFADRTARDPAFVSAVVLVELIWLLRRRFQYSSETIMQALGAMIESEGIRFEHGDKLQAFLSGGDRTIADVADALVAMSCSAAKCSHVVTFDKRLAKLIPSVELLG